MRSISRPCSDVEALDASVGQRHQWPNLAADEWFLSLLGPGFIDEPIAEGVAAPEGRRPGYGTGVAVGAGRAGIRMRSPTLIWSGSVILGFARNSRRWLIPNLRAMEASVSPRLTR